MNDAAPAAQPHAHTALSILRDDHHQLDRLLRLYALLSPTSGSQADRDGLISRIGACLHGLIEAERQVLYPLLSSDAEHDELAAARRNHHLLEERLRAMASEAEGRVAKDVQMGELAELARAHMALDDRRLYPLAGRFDSMDLGQRVALCRAQALGEQGPD